MSCLFLEGEKVLLRPLEEGDISAKYLGWLNDYDVTRYLETGRFPVSQEDLRRFLTRFQNTQSDFIFAIIDKGTETHIGNVTLNRIHWVHRTADTGIMIGEKNFLGKGYGFEAWSLLIDYAFVRLGLRKITAGAVAANTGSVKVMQKLGFRLEGTFRKEFFVEGHFMDVLRFGLFLEEFYKYAPKRA